MKIKYLVTTRNGGNTDYIFKNKTEAINKLDCSNKNRCNAVISEYVEIDGYIIAKPLDENITGASCGCILYSDFSFIQKIPLKEVKNYFNGINQKVTIEQIDELLF